MTTTTPLTPTEAARDINRARDARSICNALDAIETPGGLPPARATSTTTTRMSDDDSRRVIQVAVLAADAHRRIDGLEKNFSITTFFVVMLLISTAGVAAGLVTGMVITYGLLGIALGWSVGWGAGRAVGSYLARRDTDPQSQPQNSGGN